MVAGEGAGLRPPRSRCKVGGEVERERRTLLRAALRQKEARIAHSIHEQVHRHV